MEQYSFSGSPLSTQLQSSVNSFLQSKGWYRPNQIKTIQQSARLNPIGTLKGTLPGLNLDTDGSLSNQLSVTGALGASTVQAPSVSDVTSSLADSITNNPIQSVNKSLTTNPISNINITNPDAKLSFSQKFQNSTFGKNFGLWSAGLNMANNLFTGIAGPKSEYEGAKGDITQTMDSTYDAIQGAAGMFGPIGQAVSLGMAAGKLVGNVANKLGAGTDAMTSTDAILGSSFLQLTPFGLVNGFGGKKADTITKDEQAFEQVGSSYGGTQATVNDALTKSGKKYGAFSSGARREANREIAEAKRQQGIMSNIADEATDRFAIRDSMAAINGNRRAYYLQGGYDQANVRVGRNGMNIKLLDRARQIAKQSRKLQTGGVISDPFEVYLQSLPQAQRDSTNFRVRDYWEYNGRPKNFDEARKKGMFEWKEDFDESGKPLGWSWHAFTVAKNPNADEYDFMKSSSHPTVQKEIDWYNSDAGSEFRKEYELQKVQPYYKYVKRKAPYKDVPIHKEGGSIIELVSLPTEILLVDPNEVPEFQDGGQINKKPRTLQELIEYAKKENPRFIQRMSEPLKYVDLGNGDYATHLMGYEFDPDTQKWYVYSQVQEDDNGNLKLYDFPEAFNRALEKKNVLEMTQDEAKLFTESEELPDGTFKGYKAGWPEFFKQKPSKFQQGGSINVIPDGALHARKHNMDMEGITKKGIPVVAENEDGSVEQQAEIEKEEIIFRLEVTKKLEELEKKYYSEDTSEKEKKWLALEAGKLLVSEILHNTVDNTKNLL